MAAKPRKKTKGATRRSKPINWQLWLKRSALGLLAVGLLAGLSVTLTYIPNVAWQPMPVKTLSLTTPLQYQPEAAVDQIFESLQGRSLLGLDLTEVTQNLTLLPWVAEAKAQIFWPATIEFELVEHQPVAYWNTDSVLNGEGEVLDRPIETMPLAQLIGPAGRETEVMNNYLAFAQIFREQGLQIKALTMLPRGAWQLTTVGEIEIRLGETDVLERSRRVVKLLADPRYADRQITYIDARYPNGLAVRFEQNAESEVTNDIAA